VSKNVRILARANRVFPALIKTHPDGALLAIDAVERCWTEMSGAGRRVRFIYQVRSGGQQFLLREEGFSGRGVLSAASL